MTVTGVAINNRIPQKSVQAPSRNDVHRMFDRIAKKYDFLNRLFSFGQDSKWRKKLAKMLEENKCSEVLDLATGTADVLLASFKFNQYMRLGAGLDMAGVMLQVGQMKVERGGLTDKTFLIKSDAMSLPISDNSFDATTIAFGIRNVLDVRKGLVEMKRVLRQGGKSFVLEFSLPSNVLMRKFFLIYLRFYIPLVGGIFSGNRTAYRYLNETIETFPYGHEFARLMGEAGFRNVAVHKLTFGVAMIYEGTK
jgi:demethylmenaquinone methyltransferase/2-methoxy-6-polyprenyl-1,4-benzoquinol methylase